MIGNRSNSGVGLMLAFVLLASSVLGGEKKRSRAIEFSDPQSSENASSTNQLTSKKDGLRQLEEELFQPLQNLAPKSSLDAVMPSLPNGARPGLHPVIPNKRAKEMRERMKNWIFMAPEDQIKGLTPEEIFNLPEYDANGQEKKKLSPMEKYYDHLGRHRDGDKSRNGQKDALSDSGKKKDSNDDSPDDPSEQSAASKQTDQMDQPFKSVFDSKSPLAPLITPNAFPDVFGLAKTELSPAEVQKQKTHNIELQQMYGNPFSSFNPGADTAGRPATPIGSLMPVAGLGSFGGPEMQMQPPTATMPSFNSGTTPDFSTKPLGMGAAFTPPQLKIEAPKITPVAPSFTAPRRPF